MEVSHHATPPVNNMLLSSLSATRWIFSARLGGETRIQLIPSIAAYRRRPKSAKCHVACGLTLKALSVSRGFAVGGQKVVRVFLPRWPKTDIWRQTNALCYLLPSLNPQLQDFLGPSVLCHKTGSCCCNGFINVYRRSVILRHGELCG